MGDEFNPTKEPLPMQDDRTLFCKYHYRGVLLVLIPLVLVPILLFDHSLPYRMIYLTLCALSYYILNIFEPGAVAFTYIIFLPLVGITASKPLCIAHYTDTLYAIYGSVWLGISMESSGVASHIGSFFLNLFWDRIRILQIVLALLTAINSIFVNSTFVAAFWMKVTQDIVAEYGKSGILNIHTDEEPYEQRSDPYPTKPVIGLYLTIAYSSTLGSMISPFHNPNLAIVGVMKKTYQVDNVSYLLIYVFPMIVGLVFILFWLNLVFGGLFTGSPDINITDDTNAALRQSINSKKETAKWNIYSVTSILLIVLLELSIVFQETIFWPGWSAFFRPVYCESSMPIIVVCIIFFALPANYFFLRYYCCREPFVKGYVPSMLVWKTVHKNSPWRQIFMYTSGKGFVTGYIDSKLMVLIQNAIVRQKFSNNAYIMITSLWSIVLTNISPSKVLANKTLPSIVKLSVTKSIWKGAFPIPYATALHNQFLLPIACASNTIVAGWGNLRPFEFLLGGCVPTIVVFAITIFSTGSFYEQAFKDK